MANVVLTYEILVKTFFGKNHSYDRLCIVKGRVQKYGNR